MFQTTCESYVEKKLNWYIYLKNSTVIYISILSFREAIEIIYVFQLDPIPIKAGTKLVTRPPFFFLDGQFLFETVSKITLLDHFTPFQAILAI